MKIPRIFIDRNGKWFQDGIPVTHRWTYLENNRNLRPSKDGGFEVAEGGVVIPVEVEDTPFVIVSAELTDSGIRVGINDGTFETVTGGNSLTVNRDNIPYASIKKGVFRARFLRRAYYAIGANAKPLPGGGFVVESGGGEYKFLPEVE